MMIKSLAIYFDTDSRPCEDRKFFVRLNEDDADFADISTDEDFEYYDTVRRSELTKLVSLLNIEAED